MARSPSTTDFSIDVDGVGSFTFGRRAFRDELKTQVEYARIIEGVQPTPWLHAVATWISDLKVLTVRAPEGWDIEAMDPFDDQTYADLMKVHGGLLEKERSFRPGADKAREAAGA